MTPLLLGNLFELKYGKSLRKDRRNDGAIPVFGSNGQVDVHSESLINHPTIIVGRKGSIGEVHLVKTPSWPIDTTYFVEPLGEHKFDLDWLYRLLRTLRLQDLNRSAAIPGLNREDVYRIPILLPRLEDQIRIAHLLGKVEGLIAQRKQHLQQLDDFLKSVFLEMFGECLRDEDSYQPIVEVCNFIDYRGKTPPRVGVGIPLISAKCVRRGYFDAARLDFVSDETYRNSMTRGFPKANDVLFTTEGATFGYTCRIPRDFQKFAVGQRLITLVCKNGFRPEVLEFVLNDPHIQKKLNNRLSGSAALGIRSAELAKVAIPFPPPEAQIQFSAIVEKVEGIQSCYQQSLLDLESLYGALSQQAFKGELDLSRVSLPGTQAEEEKTGAAEQLRPRVEQGLAINLPDTVNLLDALVSAYEREGLIAQWLEAYRGQLGDTPFSVQHFLAAVQTRLAELHPDNDFALDVNDYEHIKAWVFKVLATGTLTQAFDDAGNRIELKAVQA